MRKREICLRQFWLAVNQGQDLTQALQRVTEEGGRRVKKGRKGKGQRARKKREEKREEKGERGEGAVNKGRNDLLPNLEAHLCTFLCTFPSREHLEYIKVGYSGQLIQWIEWLEGESSYCAQLSPMEGLGCGGRESDGGGESWEKNWEVNVRRLFFRWSRYY